MEDGGGSGEGVEKNQDERTTASTTQHWIRRTWKCSAVQKKEEERREAVVERFGERAGQAGSAASLHRWHCDWSAECALPPQTQGGARACTTTPGRGDENRSRLDREFMYVCSRLVVVCNLFNG